MDPLEDHELPEELREFLTQTNTILDESTSIPRRSQKTTYMCRNLLAFSLVCGMLAYYVVDPVFSRIDPILFPFFRPDTSSSQSTKLIAFLSWYLSVALSFALLSAAAISFSPSRLTPTRVTVIVFSTVFDRLAVTYSWVYIIMVLYNAVFLGLIFVLLSVPLRTHYSALPVLAAVAMFRLILVDDGSLCYLASKVTLLEPVYAFAAIDKCHSLLISRNRLKTSSIVHRNVMSFGFVNGVVGFFLVQGRFEYQVLIGMMAALVTEFLVYLNTPN
ncbi:hypothetical protein Vadar_003106 [Vaccinium darrowii]|uniref:Uncharacterized protein n=1 Tax=Vaccinium darrowii TaxID=229202 RepID=A0ACB7XX33_9ERIC|nr:hypothetical protein Vadar_003106 [Vaccinium darrowii]